MTQRKRSASEAKSSKVKSAQADSPPKAASRSLREQAVALAVLNPNAAGIDVHSDMHMVCVAADRVSPQADSELGLPANIRKFGANSCDLTAIAEWLAACGVTTVALESTGVYWIPLFELLDSRGFEVYLVEPGQLAHCGARPKTDVLDVQWIQRLHTYGQLRPSFRPPIGSWPCVATTASDRCRSAIPPATSSTCRRPSSR